MVLIFKYCCSVPCIWVLVFHLVFSMVFCWLYLKASSNRVCAFFLMSSASVSMLSVVRGVFISILVFAVTLLLCSSNDTVMVMFGCSI